MISPNQLGSSPTPIDEIARARDHLTTLAGYASFDLTPDGRIMSGCMDPRADDVLGEPQMTKMMGPGGEVGEAADHAVALTVVRKRLVTLDEALDEDLRLRRASVHGAHYDCAYVSSFAPIMGEMANPSGSTAESVNKWVVGHELGYLVTRNVLAGVQEAAGQQAEAWRFQGSPEHIVHAIDAHHPDHTNVPRMRGKAMPHFYIVNHYPTLGLDRQAKHNTAALRAQAYHDNLGARLGDVHNTHALPVDVRSHRMAALMLRSAATRTIIDKVKREAGHPLEHWEVEIGDEGPNFRRVSLAR